MGVYTLLLTGEMWRCMMGPHITRSYKKRYSEITNALRWNQLWYSAIGRLPPRITPFSPEPSVGPHTDAQGRGHIAAAYAQSAAVVTAINLPDRLRLMARRRIADQPLRDLIRDPDGPNIQPVRRGSPSDLRSLCL